MNDPKMIYAVLIQPHDDQPYVILASTYERAEREMREAVLACLRSNGDWSDMDNDKLYSWWLQQPSYFDVYADISDHDLPV